MQVREFSKEAVIVSFSVYPVWVHLYAVVQDLCSQLSLGELRAQKRRLHTNTLATLPSAQIPAKKDDLLHHYLHQGGHATAAICLSSLFGVMTSIKRKTTQISLRSAFSLIGTIVYNLLPKVL